MTLFYRVALLSICLCLSTTARAEHTCEAGMPGIAVRSSMEELLRYYEGCPWDEMGRGARTIHALGLIRHLERDYLAYKLAGELCVTLTGSNDLAVTEDGKRFCTSANVLLGNIIAIKQIVDHSLSFLLSDE